MAEVTYEVIEFPVKDPVRWDTGDPILRYMKGIGFAVMHGRDDIWVKKVYDSNVWGTTKPFFAWRVRRTRKKANRILKGLQ